MCSALKYWCVSKNTVRPVTLVNMEGNGSRKEEGWILLYVLFFFHSGSTYFNCQLGEFIFVECWNKFSEIYVIRRGAVRKDQSVKSSIYEPVHIWFRFTMNVLILSSTSNLHYSMHYSFWYFDIIVSCMLKQSLSYFHHCEETLSPVLVCIKWAISFIHSTAFV